MAGAGAGAVTVGVGVWAVTGGGVSSAAGAGACCTAGATGKTGACATDGMMSSVKSRVILPEAQLISNTSSKKLTVTGRPHMLLGVGVPARDCDAILDYRGRRYVLIEVTSALGVGLMAPDYNEAVLDHYTVIP